MDYRAEGLGPLKKPPLHRGASLPILGFSALIFELRKEGQILLVTSRWRDFLCHIKMTDLVEDNFSHEVCTCNEGETI